MDDINKYYEESGKIGIIGPIYIIILGVVSSLVLGAIYGYAIFYIPFIYLNIFITMALGGFVGHAVAIGGKYGKVRNENALLLFGFIFGLFSEYISWVSWIHAYSEQEVLIYSPAVILEVMQELSVNGAWSIFGWTPTGNWIYSIWSIEAIMIVGFSAILAMMNSVPFCEQCYKWVEEGETIEPLEPLDVTSELVGQWENENYSSLKSLEESDLESDLESDFESDFESDSEIDFESDHYFRIELLQCPSCQDSNFMTIVEVEISEDSDGEEHVSEIAVIQNLILTSSGFQKIKLIGDS